MDAVFLRDLVFAMTWVYKKLITDLPITDHRIRDAAMLGAG